MITFKEFQIKVMADVFKRKEENTFEPALYMYTQNFRAKIASIPSILFNNKRKVKENCVLMNKLAGSIYCCFASDINFTKLGREECDKLNMNFDALGENHNFSPRELSEIRKLTKEGLVFSFESLHDDEQITVFKKQGNSYIPAVGMGTDDSMERTGGGGLSNLLNK